MAPWGDWGEGTVSIEWNNVFAMLCSQYTMGQEVSMEVGFGYRITFLSALAE